MEHIRFTLKDLFATLTFCGCVAWCIAWVGPGAHLLWIALVELAVLSAIFVIVAGSSPRPKYAWLVAFLVAPCFSIFGPSEPLLLFGVFLFLAGLACAFFHLRLRSLCYVVAAGVVLVLAVGVRSGMHHLASLEARRAEFPVISLESRLAYERTREPQVPLSLSDTVANQLKKLESEDWQSHRGVRDLSELHDFAHETFVRSLGFGVMRARPSFVLEPPRNIPIDDPTPGRVPYVWATFEDDRAGSLGSELHSRSVSYFVRPETLGIIVGSGRIGFQGHAFPAAPLVHFQGQAPLELAQLDLVSLLRFDRPRAYVLDHLPRMDQLSDDPPTRELTEFESGGLQELRGVCDIVAEHTPDGLRMIGSIRAATQCLECHRVQRGELLGAFSYVLRYAPADQSPAASTAATP